MPRPRSQNPSWRPRLRRADVFLPGRPALRVLRRDPQPDFGAHRHEGFCELVLVLGGHGLHQTGLLSTPLAAGDAFVIHGGREHHYRKTRQLSLVNVVFGAEWLPQLSAELGGLPGFRAFFQLEPGARERGGFRQFMRLAPAELQALLPLVESLETEIEEAGPGYEACAKGAFLQLCALLSRHYVKAAARAPGGDPLLALGRVLSHLERHYAEDQSLPALAKLAGMSERNLRRHFSAALGRSPAAHLLGLRLEAAKRLLEEGSHKVTEAATACGFNDANYFTRQFRRAHGLSPRAWLKRQAQET
jgi:AraC family L-rhamnose operon transcriptional activator RhaR/AraC family L-rhamnose operon regulatory protein RhaS